MADFQITPLPARDLLYCPPSPSQIYFYVCVMEGGYFSEQFGTNLVLLDQKLASQEQF